MPLWCPHDVAHEVPLEEQDASLPIDIAPLEREEFAVPWARPEGGELSMAPSWEVVTGRRDRLRGFLAGQRLNDRLRLITTVHGKDPQLVLDEVGWCRTGQQEDFPESPTTCATPRPGWFSIIMSNRADAYDGTLDLEHLWKGAQVLACFVEEHVMFGTRTTSDRNG